jgi:dTDP-4-amino-4,6-dideoxygalactose transaminase
MLIVPHNRLYFDGEEEQAVRQTLRSGYWACGRKVEQLEKRLCQMSGRRYCVCVSSGLSALRLALLAIGIREGGRVIIPAYSCVALANAVLACGAEPIAIDVEKGYWTLDPAGVIKEIKCNGADAIVAVDMFGAQANIDALKKKKIPVIEDFAHFFWKKKAGYSTRADIAITSFYATKLIAGGEGGAILTDNKKYADFVRDWRDYTNKLPDKRRLNEKMTDIEAALALAQLKKVKSNIAKREQLAKIYLKAFLKDEWVKRVCSLPMPSEDRVWYRFAVLLKNCYASEAIDFLNKKGIVAAVPVVDWREKRFLRDTPNADCAYKFLLSLPLYAPLKKSEQQRVIHGFDGFCRMMSH